MPEPISIAHDELHELLKQLVGKTAWRGMAGSGTGSIFTLQFGAVLPGDKPWGEFSLMVYCAWRIVAANQILLSWHDDSDSVLAPGLAALHELLVTAVELSPWNDLTLRFANGQELQIINDFSPFSTFDTSWFIIHNNQVVYSVNPANSIDCEYLAR